MTCTYQRWLWQHFPDGSAVRWPVREFRAWRVAYRRTR